ncbi:hypothetical protein DSO57_1004622 [Entomophthora muscae]|uniref:Uncharacterized protein n=1 Tax=Entomophthora muscae TaxID=34485 RepID=A0ACC2SL43_9FUNG|nr:hypothetical protein DSO57_1004622 [Entomophthora muscae]
MAFQAWPASPVGAQLDSGMGRDIFYSSSLFHSFLPKGILLLSFHEIKCQNNRLDLPARFQSLKDRLGSLEFPSPVI